MTTFDRQCIWTMVRLLAGGIGYWAIAILLSVFFVRETQPASQWEIFGGLGGLVIAYWVGRRLIRVLPLYVAHGQTRHQFMSQAALVGIAYTASAAVVMAVGLLFEAWVYRTLEWAHLPNFSHLFGSPSQFWLVFVEFWLLFVVAAVAGALIAAGRYRKKNARTPWGSVLYGVALVMMAASVVGITVTLPIHFDVSPPVPVAIAICVGVIGLGLASTWAVVRDISIRSGTA